MTRAREARGGEGGGGGPEAPEGSRPRGKSPALGPIVHVVAAGEVGGAERMLVRLASGGPGSRRHVVALWTDDPAVRTLFQEAGLTVVSPPQRTARTARTRKGKALTPRLRMTGQPDVAWLAAYLASIDAAAVQLHTFASHVLGTRAGMRAGVPVIRTEHSRRVYDNWACRPFSAWSLRRAARVVAVSQDLRRVVAARSPWLGERLSVIYNGVPLGRPAPAPSPDGPIRFVLVARLEPRKAIDRALRAVAQVPDARLEVVGDGPLRGQLEALAAALGLGERVRFWGYRVDPETVVAEADAAICSSIAEALSLGLLEAMALGRPVVTVPVGGVPELMTDGEVGWLADAVTEEALTAAVRAAVAAGRPELRRRGARARVAVERSFSEEAMRRAYEDLYDSLPGTSTPGSR